jgi:hypothetical protein
LQLAVVERLVDLLLVITTLNPLNISNDLNYIKNSDIKKEKESNIIKKTIERFR